MTSDNCLNCAYLGRHDYHSGWCALPIYHTPVLVGIDGKCARKETNLPNLFKNQPEKEVIKPVKTEIDQSDLKKCIICGTPTNQAFQFCNACWAKKYRLKLAEKCQNCGKPIEAGMKLCNTCFIAKAMAHKDKFEAIFEKIREQREAVKCK